MEPARKDFLLPVCAASNACTMVTPTTDKTGSIHPEISFGSLANGHALRQSEQSGLLLHFPQSGSSSRIQNVIVIATTGRTGRVPDKSPIFRYSELHIAMMIDD